MRTIISFSGGRTSAYMLWLMWNNMPHDELEVVFANTGLEDERTLAFVDRVACEWSIPVVWLEADVHPASGIGTGYNRVSFRSASRKGEPFAHVIAKYGIPNQAFPHCTRELKVRPIEAYSNRKSERGSRYKMAIGIRADEPKRIKQHPFKVYPLVTEWPSFKRDVLDFWADQPFNLGLEEHEGNCVTCWKKSDAKLMRIARENPNAFDFMRSMETQHAFTGAGATGEPRKFFRGFKSADQIIAASSLIMPLVSTSMMLDFGCSESCEAF